MKAAFKMNGKSIRLTYFDFPKSVYVLVFARIISSVGNFVFPFMTLLLASKIGLGERQFGLFLLMALFLMFLLGTYEKRTEKILT